MGFVIGPSPFSTLVIVGELTGDFGLIASALGVCIGCFVLSGRESLFESFRAAPQNSPAACGKLR